MCIVDFTDVSEVLVFTSNISRLCVNVTITEDDLVERDEYFTVSLSTDLEFPVNLYPNSSKEITIVNDDCKLLYLSHDVIIVSMHCVPKYNPSESKLQELTLLCEGVLEPKES